MPDGFSSAGIIGFDSRTEAVRFLEDTRVRGHTASFSAQASNLLRSDAMTSEEQITKMKKAINQAIKVMGDRFGSTEGDVERAIDELKASMQTAPPVGVQSPQMQVAVAAEA
jgi:ElaB/YqjD/DUF883 family membrane-anchored ribosome-binding protein